MQDVAVTHIVNDLRYKRLADHGPKLGPISFEHPLVDSYFRAMPGSYPARPAPQSLVDLQVCKNYVCMYLCHALVIFFVVFFLLPESRSMEAVVTSRGNDFMDMLFDW
jgi:hypothetical protein